MLDAVMLVDSIGTDQNEFSSFVFQPSWKTLELLTGIAYCMCLQPEGVACHHYAVAARLQYLHILLIPRLPVGYCA
jgi:hypothetical protein